MKCLGTCHFEARPVLSAIARMATEEGYGMISRRGHRIVLHGEQSPASRITPFPTGRIISTHFPGISCLATFISSLRDKGPFPGLFSFAPSEQNVDNSRPKLCKDIVSFQARSFTFHLSPITSHRLTPTQCRLTYSSTRSFGRAGSDTR